ncbi:unnamed protein product [Penicillium nalgiovense]|uniref:Uncharacterized protein n=1 Tax=Penicillium nalgiovense TaxID=60175 RepID=A0A1V6Y9Y9_PENNA|nr:hypothetical protein PENNAL_c0027G11077 [Penicillium nalgiovense]CAG7957259.1 unnamed protein product [Penicillium nalgiovense]CAG8016415.1 unnamed protein product [Penicillium nalgiovense]CAG8033013.1 unnamed protein product [Penicillium nalgiovense]CAG8043741.1 unnamed protein product [Penicillium nalgiovense]
MLRLPMHQFDSPHDCAVAPSPIVRTYRPDPPSKRRITNMNMTSTKTGPPPKPLTPRPRGGSAPRPEARSAGMAERAGRNEGLVDMVRFLQSQNMPSQPPPLSLPPSQPQPRSRAPSQPQPSSPSDTTTALPVPISPKEPKAESKPDSKQDPKPFHRRLLQFAQRPKKESSPRSKQEEQQRQIEALTRGGYLIPATPPKESKGQKEAKRSKESLSLSLSRSLSKSKKDVENIGQPWLQAKVDCDRRPTETRRRLGSLDLAAFGSMVDVAVSLTPDLDDSMPPPYQPTDHNSQSPSAFPTSSSAADPSPQTITRPASSLASTSHSYRDVSIDEQIQRPSSSAESSTRADPVSHVTINTSVGGNKIEPEPKPKPSIEIQKRNQSEQASVRNITPLSPTLKLFPDVAPPRTSSRGPWGNPSIPRYQMIENTRASPASPLSSPRIGPSGNEPKAPDEPRKSSDGFINAPVSETEPKCPGALAPCATSSAEALSIEKAPKDSASQDETTIRPLSLSLGTLQAFPLPAPTRPLPSLPKTKGSPTTPDTNTRSSRGIDSETLSSNLHSPSTALVEDQEIGSHQSTALGSLDAGGSMADDEESLFTTSLSEHYQPTPEHCTPSGRVSSVRIPRMQDLPESPSSQCDAEVSKGQPLADSPVLGHSIPAKSNGKRAALKVLQINSQVSRKNLPFGLPSPPPTASLPSVPPPQHPPPPPPGRNIGQRNYTAPNVTTPPLMRNMEAHPTPGPYRGSALSRSNSSGSSLRHESFPETYRSRPESHPGSPLPSSDDEVFGPEIDAKHSRREADNYQRQPTRRGYVTTEPRQMSSRNRLRYPNPARPMTPQSRSIHSLEKTSSPQSQYSQSTHRSRESQSSQHIHAAPQVDHYLEDRVANLERQNQILQAALMAALNAGVKNPLQGLNLDPNMPSNSPHTVFAHQYPGRHTSRPDSWVSSSRSSEHSGFETSSSYREGRASVKQLDNMIEDIETGWLSDKSSLSGTRIARK